nr:hybrid sensor histidine kinase/response regulator [Thiorhodococcus mannitoliphagus]
MLIAGAAEAKPLSAVDGVLDLRGWSPPAHGWQAVTGEWLFDWGRFLAPEAGSAPLPGTVLRPWNGPWWGTRVDGERIGGQGFATYRLRIIPPAQSPPLAIFLPSPRRSYRVWVNGEWLGQSGEPSAEPRLRRTPDREIVIPLPPGADSYQLLIETSNYISLLGTAPQPMLLGTREALQRTLNWSTLMTLLALGAGLVFGLKYLILLITRRRYSGYLWIALLSFDIALQRFAFAANYLPDLLTINQTRLTWLLMLAVFSLGPLITLLVHRLYPRTHPPWLLRLVLIPHLALLALTLVAPLAYSELMLMVMTPYFLVVVYALVYCSWRTVRTENATALWLLAATLVLALTATRDLLWNLGFIVSPQSYVFNLSILLLLLVVLFDQYDIDVFQQIKRLTKNLQTQVAERTRALTEKVAALQAKEQELTSAYARLEDLSRTKSRFLAAASHDLRQPLHAMGLQIGLLEERIQDDEARRTLQSVREAQGTLNETLTALLDISKIDSGLLKPRRRSFALRELFARLGSQLRPVAERQGVVLRLRAGGYWVDSDPVLLYRMLANLLDNALKHAEAKSILLGTRWSGREVVIEVRDDGRGIPLEQQPQIFDEFVQIQSAGQRRPPGMGLGLSVVRRLGQLLEHPISLSSVPGGGTRFRLCVKRGEPQEACASPAVSSPARAYDLASKRVLLIDDDASVREATAQLLGAWHCQILTAADPSQALKLAEGQAIDILVVDYRFPGGDTGLDVIAALDQQAGRAHPAVIITGEVDPDVLRRLQASPYPVLSKPVAPISLRSALHRLLLKTD